MTNQDEVIAKFYEELKSTIGDIEKLDKLLILGDFYARVGSDQSCLGKSLRHIRVQQQRIEIDLC